jgi:hypothetical protein
MRTVALEEHFTVPDLVRRIDRAAITRRGFRPRRLAENLMLAPLPNEPYPEPTPADPNPAPARPPGPAETPLPEPIGVPPAEPQNVPAPNEPIGVPPINPPEIPVTPTIPQPRA